VVETPAWAGGGSGPAMKIAFLGTRGVPAHYSGFETFVEEMGSRLVERGHEVTVYCRRHHCAERPATHRGMNLLYVRGVATKHLDTISHTLISCLHAVTSRYDVVIMCISGNSPLAVIPRMAGAKVVMNVDGSDWRRKKWGRGARTYIRVSEWLATHLPDATVTDSRVMQRYYSEHFGVQTECIVYGADVPEPTRQGILEELGLRPRGYFLLVGRLVPENCAHHLVEAYERLESDLSCVVVGDAPYAGAYIRDLKRRGPRVIFPGYVFGDGYRELMRNAYAVVLCSEVGGTHPVLVEAMAAGNCVVVNDTPTNLEVIGDAGISYAGSAGAVSLRQVLADLEQEPERVETYRQAARERAETCYTWTAVTDAYERLLERLAGQGIPPTSGAVLVAADSGK
jgi:glycosyltransferase involved in cell wall biosynthesis